MTKAILSGMFISTIVGCSTGENMGGKASTSDGERMLASRGECIHDHEASEMTLTVLSPITLGPEQQVRLQGGQIFYVDYSGPAEGLNEEIPSVVITTIPFSGEKRIIEPGDYDVKESLPGLAGGISEYHTLVVEDDFLKRVAIISPSRDKTFFYSSGCPSGPDFNTFNDHADGILHLSI